jgi:RHS repeat-associated protein
VTSRPERPRARLLARIGAMLVSLLVVAGQAVTGPAAIVAHASGGGIAYAYDENGRLLSASVPGGDTAVYSYDPLGNLLGIARHPSSQLSIVHFSPAAGPAGSTVTISGTGFASTPAGNTLTFNGTAAAVTSASPTQLVVQVPAGAGSGPIGVSTGGAPVMSASPFAVRGALTPSITSISPTVAVPGTAITIAGANFQAPDLTGNRVVFNHAQSFATTGSATSLTANLPPFATSGPVTISTPFGKQVGPDVIVPPAPYTPANLDSTGRLTVGGAPRSVPVSTAGNVALWLFDGQQGQRVSMQLGWTGSGATFTILTPTGRSLWSGGTGFVDPLTLPQDGTYSLLIVPASGGTGTASVELWTVPPDLTPALTLGASPLSATTTVRGQNVLYSFAGTQGQRVSAWLGFAGTSGSGWVNYTIRNPDGTQLYGNCCNGTSARIFVDPLTLTATGTYTVLVDPTNDVLGTATVEVWSVPADVSPSLTLGAGPVTAPNNVRGQNVAYTFSGTQGQRVSARLSFTTSSGFGWINYTIKNPDGTTLYNNCCNGTGSVIFVDPLTLPATGTYTILVDPTNDILGTASAEAWSVPADVSPTLTLGASLVTAANTVRGQNIAYTFSGTQGQRVSARLEFTASSGSGWINYTVKNPDGTTLFSNCCNGSGSVIFVDPLTLPATGTYTILVDPTNDILGTASAEAWSVPADATTPVTVGGAQASLANTVRGQNVVFTFTAAQNQRISAQLRFTAASGSGWINYTIKNPDGTTLFSNCCNGSGATVSMNATVLSQAGTYTILVDPTNDILGTAQATVLNVPLDATGTLTLGGGPVSVANTIRDQNIVYSFSGTQSERVSMKLSFALTSGSGSVNYTVRNPDGSTLYSNCCNGTSAAIFVDPLMLPATGTYTILVDPTNDVIGTATAEAWDVPADVAATLTLGASPLNATNTVSGQNIVYSFTGAANERVSAKLTFARAAGSGSINYTIRKPDGGALYSNCCNGSGSVIFVDPLTLPVAGTYTILVDPTSDLTGTATVEAWDVPADVSPALTLGAGPLTAANTVRGQNVVYSFTGAANERVSARLTFTRTSGSGWINYTIRKPDGSTLYSNCCNGSGAVIFVDPLTLPVAGTYTILVDPTNDILGTASAEAWDVPADAAGSVTIGGARGSLANTVRGQNVVFTFPGTSGQRITGQFGFTATSGSGWINYTVKNPDGTTLYSNCCNGTGATVTMAATTLAQTGTFTILVDPTNDVLGTASAQVSLATGTAAVVSATGVQAAAPPPPAAPQAPPPAPAAGSALTMPALQAPPGVTAIAGQAVTLDGAPLAGVTLRIGRVAARTDETGRFLLQGLPAGRAVLEIDGATANGPGASYGFFEAGLNVVARRTSILPFPIWMTKLDTAHEVTFDSPTTSEVVLTNPSIPGLEVRLPKGTVVKDRGGKVLRKLSLTAIPVDKPPFPLPIGVTVPIYFTVQPGGSYVLPKGARLVYPNFTHLAPGTRVEFWDYDAAKKGWYVYGEGTVTKDGSQVVPDPGVVVYEFSGAMINGNGFTKWLAGILHDALGIAADPVDLGTGTFDYQKTDLTLSDTLPLVLTRTHIQGDSVVRPFGVGMTHSFDINIFSEQQYQQVDLYIPGSQKIHFVRTSPGTSWTDAVFQTADTTDEWFGATMVWNGNGWDLKRKDGLVLVFGENAPLQAIRDRNGNQITYIRSNGKSGAITSLVSSSGRWLSFTYDTSGRITAVHDNVGRTVSYAYDSSGRLATVTDPQGGVATYTYDAANDITSVQDARQTVFVKNTYDAGGRVTQQTLADGSTYHFAYTLGSGGRITETDVTDPLGRVRKATFDASGRLLSDTQAAGRPEQTTVTLTRDASERVTDVADNIGRHTSLSYDALGNLTGITLLPGTSGARTTMLTYEPRYSRVTRVTDALLHTTTFAYDAHGNLTQVTDPIGNATTIAPGRDGRPTSVTDALGHSATFTYDLGDLATMTDSLGRTTSRLSDGAGRLVALVDPLGNRMLNTYDVMNQLTSTTDPAGATTTYTYDPTGDLLTLKDANGHQTSFTYDTRGRVLTQSDGLGRTTTYGYDALANLTSLSDPRGQTTVMQYDGLNRRTFAGYNAVTSGGSTTYDSSIGYTYDAAGRLTAIADSLAGTIQHSFDSYDRLTQVTSPLGTISYGYDAADRLTSRTIGSSTLGYTYDAADRVTAIAQGGTTLVGFTYDAAGRRTGQTLPDGIGETFSYDAASQLTGISYKLGGTPLGDLAYAYDANGRRQSADGTWARSGLPAAATATYDAANQLATWNGAPITYDAAGNLTGDGTSTYMWDARGQLSSVTSPTVTASFGYDGIGQRTSTIVNGSATQYLHDGNNVAQVLIGGAVSASILAGGTDEYFSRTDGSGTRTFLTDALGSTVAMADAAGTVQTSYTYEPFGNATASGAADANPLQFTGRENDGTGLQFNRARYYSPTLQRFISSDPLGLAGGDVNTSAYAANSPTNLTDPSGQILPALLAGCAIGAAMSAGADIAGAMLTGSKLDVGGMLGDAGTGCLTGALFGAAGEAAGALLGRLLGGASTEAMLGEHVANAVARFEAEGMTEAQAMRAAENPNLAAAFRGERIDTFAKESVAADSRLSHVDITPRFQRGPDFIDTKTGTWYDITTPGQWDAHVAKYGPGGRILPY